MRIPLASRRLSTQIRSVLAARGQSVRAAERLAGMPQRSIQAVLDGHIPSLDRAAEIASALGYELVIRPRGAAAPEAGNPAKSPEFRRVSNEAAAPYESLRDEVRRRVDGEGLRPLAASVGVPVGHLRSLLSGRAASITTVESVAAALGYEFVIRPRGAAAPEAGNPAKSPEFRRVSDEAAAPSTPGPTPGPGPDAALGPLADRHIAEILAALADEYAAADGRTREALRIRFWHAYPELSARPARTSCRVCGAGGDAAPEGAPPA